MTNEGLGHLIFPFTIVPPLVTKSRERLVDQTSHAHMACDTCRKRRKRCDEQRPKCGSCQRLNVPCIYQEPKLTKKDNTLMLILRTLDSITLKIDHVLSSEKTADVAVSSNDLALSANSGISLQDIPRSLKSFQVPARQATAIQNLLAWPAVQSLLECDGVNLSRWHGHYQGTESWLKAISADFPKMAIDQPMEISYSEHGILVLMENRSISLNRIYVESLCAAYFRTFHCTFPILDLHDFYNDLLPRICSQSFGEAHEGSALVLLVLALGSLAQEGATGSPINDETGRETGIRGGTVLQPPGHMFLTEARRRLGFAMTSWNLNNLQCFILLAVYYSQVSRNLEFWRIAIFACTICKSLVKTIHHWNTAESDQTVRCFWICCFFEGGLSGEMGLEVAGISALEDSVPLPLFISGFRDQATKSDDELFIEYHFLAQITLRTLMNRVRKSTQETKGNLFQMAEQGRGQSDSVAKELSRQLYDWRAHLPSAIAWADQPMDDIAMSSSDPNNHREASTPLDPALAGMIDFRTILDASLRSRYKYAEYIIWRPYIFRVLHSPQDPAWHDVECCGKAFEACTLWPLTFAIFHSQRRLVPHIYEYTHTFFGILILMHVCSFNQFLGPLLHSMPAAFAPEVSIGLYLSWIRDMKVVHPVARWCWQLLKIVYKDHELVKELDGGCV
ncbi:hypothetical protein WAI453_006418 [Rhynchosporium graminicola]